MATRGILLNASNLRRARACFLGGFLLGIAAFEASAPADASVLQRVTSSFRPCRAFLDRHFPFLRRTSNDSQSDDRSNEVLAEGSKLKLPSDSTTVSADPKLRRAQYQESRIELRNGLRIGLQVHESPNPSGGYAVTLPDGSSYLSSRSLVDGLKSAAERLATLVDSELLPNDLKVEIHVRDPAQIYDINDIAVQGDSADYRTGTVRLLFWTRREHPTEINPENLFEGSFMHEWGHLILARYLRNHVPEFKYWIEQVLANREDPRPPELPELELRHGESYRAALSAVMRPYEELFCDTLAVIGTGDLEAATKSNAAFFYKISVSVGRPLGDADRGFRSRDYSHRVSFLGWTGSATHTFFQPTQSYLGATVLKDLKPDPATLLQPEVIAEMRRILTDVREVIGDQINSKFRQIRVLSHPRQFMMPERPNAQMMAALRRRLEIH